MYQIFFWILLLFYNSSLGAGRTVKDENAVLMYTLEKAKPDSTENVLLYKNPQFLSNYYETLWK